MFEQAGADASVAFEDVGHSPDAYDMLNEFVVGELVEVPTLQPDMYSFNIRSRIPDGSPRKNANPSSHIYNINNNPKSCRFPFLMAAVGLAIAAVGALLYQRQHNSA